MKRLATNFIILCIMMLCLVLPSSSHAHDSFMDFQQYILKGQVKGNCVERGLVITNIEALKSNGTAEFGSAMPIIAPNNTKSWYKKLKLRVENYSAAALAGVDKDPITKFGFVSDYDSLLMESACRSAYVYHPSEYTGLAINKFGCQVSANNNSVSLTAGSVTQANLPYYYHCDPNFDPSLGTAEAGMVGRTQGYAGAQSKMCTDNVILEKKDMVGKIAVGYYPDPAFNGGSYNNCDTSSLQTVELRPGDEPVKLGNLEVIAYIDEGSQNKNICAATVNTKYPIKIGCTRNSPILMNGDSQNFWQSTSCFYLNHPRSDLHALGNMLGGNNASGPTAVMDDNGNFSLPAVKFLKSNFHPLSNVTSCIRDVISWVMLGPPGSGNQNSFSFYAKVQTQMRNIVLATLLLAVMIFGIHIMLQAEQLTKEKVIVMAIKISLVGYFTLGDAWDTVFPWLMSFSSEMMSILTGIQFSNDYGRLCTFMHDGQELLTDRALPAVNNISTLGYGNAIKLTYWDYLDCKLINYANIGTCQYEPLTIFLVVVAGLFSGGGALLVLISAIYLALIFLMVLKLTQIFILALFTVCILVLLSPIFTLFCLFNATKSIFDNWLRAILGYLLYAPLATICFTLLFMSLDSMYYGDIEGKTPSRDANGAPLYAYKQGTAASDQTGTPCYKVNSPFCVSANFFEKQATTNNQYNSKNLCMITDPKELGDKLFYSNYFPFIETDKGFVNNLMVTKDNFINKFLPVLAKMALWAYIFYQFVSMFNSLISALLGITSFDSAMGGKTLGVSINPFAIKRMISPPK